jgi:arylsulfatase A-like enzyme
MIYGRFYNLDENRTLISERFRTADYDTAGFNSNPYLSEEFGYGRGFDTFSDWKGDPSITARFRQFFKNNVKRNSYLYNMAKRLWSATERTMGIEIGSLYTRADDLTDAAINWIESHPENGNFLWIHYMDVHHPYVPPPVDQRALGQAVTEDRDALKLRRKLLEEPEAATDEDWAEIVDLYDAEIHFTDREIGRLLEAAQSHWGEVVTAVTSDHGEEFNEHGAFGHEGTFYDELLHVPLLLADGDCGRYDDILGLIDLAPTLLEYGDVSVPDSYDGHSLRTLIGDGSWPREAVVSHVDDKVYYRDSRWKYIKYGDQEELYSLEEDPGETKSCFADEPEVVEEIKDRLEDYPIEPENIVDVSYSDVNMDEDMQSRLRDLGYKE